MGNRAVPRAPSEMCFLPMRVIPSIHKRDHKVPSMTTQPLFITSANAVYPAMPAIELNDHVARRGG